MGVHVKLQCAIGFKVYRMSEEKLCSMGCRLIAQIEVVEGDAQCVESLGCGV